MRGPGNRPGGGPGGRPGGGPPDSRNDRYMMMTNAPIMPLLIRISIPTIIAMLVSAIYNVTDTFFMGKTGETVSIAAIGVVFNLMTFVQAAGFLFGYGSGNYMSRKLGEQDSDSAADMAATGFVLALITGAISAVVCMLLKGKLIKVLGGAATPELEAACNKYITYIILSIPAIIGSFTLNNQLRLQGSPADGMKGMSIGMFLNIILDPVFIFGMKMGIAGAGLATLIGQYAGFVGLIIMTAIHGNIKIEFFRVTMSGELLGELFGGGSPNFIRQGITTVATVLLTHAAGEFGDNTISAITITSRICALGFAVVLGFGQGFQPICGYNFGAERYDRIKLAFNACLRITTGFLAVVTIIQFVFAQNIVMIFEKNDTHVIELGTKILRYQCVSFITLGYSTLVGMMLQNIGKYFGSAVVSSMRQGICFIPLVFLMPMAFGIDGLAMIQPAADIFTFAFSILFGVSAFRFLKRSDFYW